MPETHLTAWPTEADDEAIDELVEQLTRRGRKSRIAAAMLTVHLARSVLALRGTLANIDERLRRLAAHDVQLAALNSAMARLVTEVHSLERALGRSTPTPRRRGRKK